jgi:hypothetical protein
MAAAKYSGFSHIPSESTQNKQQNAADISSLLAYSSFRLCRKTIQPSPKPGLKQRKSNHAGGHLPI